MKKLDFKLLNKCRHLNAMSKQKREISQQLHDKRNEPIHPLIVANQPNKVAKDM